MSQLRRDPVTGRWTITEIQQPSGPEAYPVEPVVPSRTQCPFCAGNESMTPTEISSIRAPGTPKDGPGWQMRVIPNKFPALRIEGMLTRRGIGVFDQCEGIGAHEVVIETPDHQRQTADLSVKETAQLIELCKVRSIDLAGDPRLKYSLIFKNHGPAAGATLEHAHSQVIALPIVPKRVEEELRGAERYLQFRERCVFCDALYQELQDDERLVCENRSFAAYCPFVSRFPFEIWILPKEHAPDFTQISPQAIEDFARLLKETLLRVRLALSNPPYNFIVHTAPADLREREAYHWHLELIPQLTSMAGFEWGTGFYINPTPPELAARYLREVVVSV